MSDQIDVTLSLKAAIDKKLRGQPVVHRGTAMEPRAASVVIEGKVHVAAKLGDTWTIAGGGGVVYRDGQLGATGEVEVTAVW